MWIPMSAADAAAVNPNGIKIFLGFGLTIFFIDGRSVFSNVLRSFFRNLPDCVPLDSWLFEILFQQINYLQKLYEDLKLFCQLVIIYIEN